MQAMGCVLRGSVECAQWLWMQLRRSSETDPGQLVSDRVRLAMSSRRKRNITASLRDQAASMARVSHLYLSRTAASRKLMRPISRTAR